MYADLVPLTISFCQHFHSISIFAFPLHVFVLFSNSPLMALDKNQVFTNSSV